MSWATGASGPKSFERDAFYAWLIPPEVAQVEIVSSTVAASESSASQTTTSAPTRCLSSRAALTFCAYCWQVEGERDIFRHNNCSTNCSQLGPRELGRTFRFRTMSGRDADDLIE